MSNFEEQVAAIIAEGTTEEKFDKLSSEGEAKSIVQVSVKEVSHSLVRSVFPIVMLVILGKTKEKRTNENASTDVLP